jgi:hypothetical protein
MATLKDVLKSYFTSGKKPTQQHFHELIDSYFHKTDDKLAISDDGNLGIGVDTPDARLHIGGGLKIGSLPDDLSQVSQGTLRWTGTKLQIAFESQWKDVWSGEQNFSLKSQAYDLGQKRLSQTIKSVSVGPLNFPDKSVQLLRVAFTINYGKVSTSKGSTRNLSIILLSPASAELWSQEIPLTNGIFSNFKIGPIDLPGNQRIENMKTFSLKFAITGSGGSGSNTIDITLVQAEVSCLIKVA